MLFDNYRYFDYQFPEPQYLGAKHTHLSWINKFIPKDIDVALDAFAGSQSVGYLFKQLGLRTIANDFLNFNTQIGKALIENKSEKLNADDLAILFQEAPKKDNFTLMEDVFTDVFFKREESVFIDNFRANIPLLNSQYKQALAFAVMNRSLTRKITMGHFGHTQALVYASDPERIKRNRSLVRPIKEIFSELLPKYNNAIFDNGKDNQSFNENILDLLPKLSNIDLVYFDPPYCNSHADYQGFYHLLETYTEYWRDKKFVNGIRRYEPQKYSGFDKKSEIITSFEKLFEASNDIPYWLISYNNRSYPDIQTFEKMISRFRDVKIEYKTYHNGRGGKGSVAGSKEILFVCAPKSRLHHYL
ncbi:DNA adenine methylase [Bacteroides sp. 224]|uniref:DNA adenine methylase n=1 Tax=Bacteroides sp. 224 TaxID=2302936 RepID=UPI0013D2D54E|nr:DNA adenine methylase [Bacteroides sp. 224]NDV65665.1 DNA methyltransferase [Bacteroides sp. 224]